MHAREAEVFIVAVDDFFFFFQYKYGRTKESEEKKVSFFFFSYILVSHLEDDPEEATSMCFPQLSHRSFTSRAKSKKTIYWGEV